MPLRGGGAYQGGLSLFNIMLNLMLSHALSMLYLCTIYAPVHALFPVYAPSMPRPFTAHSPPIHRPFTAHSPSILRPFSVHSPSAPSMPRLCLGYKAVQKNAA